MHGRERTARRSSTTQTMQIKPKISDPKKVPVPSNVRVLTFCLIGTPCTDQKRKKSNSRASLSLVRRPSISRPPHHRIGPGKDFLSLCHSEPRLPLRVKPGAHRSPRSPARQSWCSDCVALSVNFSLVAKTSTAWILTCNPERPL